MKRSAAIACLLVFFCASSVRAAPTAKSFLQSIYGHYIGKDAHGVELDTAAEVRRYLAPPLAAAILADRAAAKGEVGNIDGDIFIDAQDWEIASFAIATDEKPDRASATVRFVNLGKPIAIALDLVLLKDSWRISEINYGDRLLSKIAKGIPDVLLGGDIPKKGPLTIDALKAMGPTTATWSSHGETHQVLGERLDRILAAHGFTKGEMGKEVPKAKKRAGFRKVVLLTAEDGYQALVSCAEITEGMGNTVALLVWEIDGKPLDEQSGPLRLVITTDGEPSRSIYAVRNIAVLDIPALLHPHK